MAIPILYCLVSGSAITDLCRQKIFNKWLLLGVLGGIATAFIDVSPEPLFMKLIRAAVMLIAMLPVYKLGGLGAGDIKLFMVIALFLSSEELLSAVVLSFVIGAIIGIIKIVLEKSFRQTIHFALPILISVLLVTNTHCILSF